MIVDLHSSFVSIYKIKTKIKKNQNHGSYEIRLYLL